MSPDSLFFAAKQTVNPLARRLTPQASVFPPSGKMTGSLSKVRLKFNGNSPVGKTLPIKRPKIAAHTDPYGSVFGNMSRALMCRCSRHISAFSIPLSVSKLGAASCRWHQLCQIADSLVGGGAARCSSPCLPPLARIWSMRRGRPRRKNGTMHEVHSIAIHIRAIVSSYVRPIRRKTSAAARGLLRLDSRRLLQRVWLADKSTNQCFSTRRTNPQTKGSQQLERYRARRFAECRHESLSVSARRSLWLSPTAPVPPPRFACFVSGSIEAIRRASISQCKSICSPMHCPAGFAAQMPSGQHIGSLFVRCQVRLQYPLPVSAANGYRLSMIGCRIWQRFLLRSRQAWLPWLPPTAPSPAASSALA